MKTASSVNAMSTGITRHAAVNPGKHTDASLVDKTRSPPHFVPAPSPPRFQRQKGLPRTLAPIPAEAPSKDGREAKTGVREHPGHAGGKIEGESWGRDSPKDVQLGPRTVPRAPSTRQPLAVRSSSGLSGASSQILCLFTSRRLVATGHRARASAPSFRVKTLRRLLK